MDLAGRLGVLCRMLARAVSKLALSLDSHELIELSENLYFRVPKIQLNLRSIGGPGSDIIQSMNLPITQVKELFCSIQRACDLSERIEVKVGDLYWVTDARPGSDGAAVLFKYDGPLGRGRVIAKRQDVINAALEFEKRFG